MRLYSVIIPVYNRPDEVGDLLASLARNYAAARSRGEYLLIVDSDCVLPACYIEQVHDALKHFPVDAFGGPDRTHPSFSPMQKAIGYAMTSFFYHRWHTRRTKEIGYLLSPQF